MNSLRLIVSNKNYFSAVFVFTSLNVWFGTWAIYIPHVKQKLDIDKAELGIAMFFLAFGVFAIFPFASKLIEHFGVGKVTWYGVVLNSFFVVGPIVAPSYATLCISLFFFGLSNGLTDIAMNTLVTELEKRDKVQFMSAAHGFFSLGGILIGLGSFLIPVIDNPPLHVVVVAVVVLTLNFILCKNYVQVLSEPIVREPFSFKLFKPLLLLGIIGFLSFASEGAVVDWSALYLQEIAGAPEIYLGAGFLAFSFAMTLGRFLGDGITNKIGSKKLIVVGGLIATIGYLGVLTESTFLCMLGFSAIGLGFSVIVPELFRLGGKMKGVNAAQGIAFIAGVGYAGFLTGPVVFGFMAELYNLKISFWLLLFSALAVVLIANSIRLKKA